MDVFELRQRLVDEYASYIQSFLDVADPRIQAHVPGSLAAGLLWPDPLIQLNPSFEPGPTIDDLVRQGVLHEECGRIFRVDKAATGGVGRPLRLHRHQAEAIEAARTGRPYVLTTGTGSGKSLAYVVPAVDHVLRRGSGRGIQAVVVYLMNALANSQLGELEKFLCDGYPDRKGPVSSARYTGQEKDEERHEIIDRPPDILLTNYVMLELLLTSPREGALIKAARGLRFLVLDELHTYRGRQGADVALLVRHVREAFEAPAVQSVGTSATLGGSGSYEGRRVEVARVASLMFGAEVRPEHVIGETRRRATLERDATDAAFVASLRAALAAPDPPFRWNDDRRFHLRCELDAAFFRLYGLSRDDATYVMDTFAIVRRADESRLGAYRTQRLILEFYDLLKSSVECGSSDWPALSSPRTAGPGS